MPARLARIVAVAESFGISVERPSRGSHWKAKKPGYRTYPIPAHNGLRSEISDFYIAGFCRAFEIDLAEFKNRF
jgi:hypothetical protein